MVYWWLGVVVAASARRCESLYSGETLSTLFVDQSS
jgi:hypothetical protein